MKYQWHTFDFICKFDNAFERVVHGMGFYDSLLEEAQDGCKYFRLADFIIWSLND